MAPLVTASGLSKSFASQQLFGDLSLTIMDGERVGLIGPNGSGKSTLLKMIAGVESADAGTIAPRRQLRLGYLAQDVSFPNNVSVTDVISDTLLKLQIPEGEESARLKVILGKIGFVDGSQKVRSLSGGWQKRLAIANEWVKEPDLFLLDEPTNHLDLEGIQWLEEFLSSVSFASLIVSHDRYFLENVATRMLELNPSFPQGLFSVNGNYSTFLEKKQDYLNAQSRQQESLANRVRTELEWLRRGPKARRGKSKARTESAWRMIEDLADSRARSSEAVAQINFTASHRKTKRLLVAEGIGKTVGEQTLFSNLSFVLSPGVKLGVVGPNGSGKTSLLKLLAGEIDPDSGRLETAKDLRVVFFDQNREQLDLAQTLHRSLASDGDAVIYRDRSYHVASYAKRFLFKPEQLQMPVGQLSGGERARVLIARLMLRPADLLLLDEPTNDLDIPTLEILEESLLEFPGAVVLVTHDRFLLDRVSSAVLGLDGKGASGLYADLSQCEQANRERNTSKSAATTPAKDKTATGRVVIENKRSRRLSYLENLEWEGMELKILAAEQELASLQAAAEDPAIVADAAQLQERYAALQRAEIAVERLYERWAELESKQDVVSS